MGDGAGLVIAVSDTEAEALARGDDWEPERHNLLIDTPYCFRHFTTQFRIMKSATRFLWRRYGGGIAPWAFFSDGGCNIGDHHFLSLDVLDEVSYYRESLGDTFPCPSCGEAFGGVVIEIRDGMISGVRAFSPGEYDSLADIYLLSSDGSRRPMVEWYDRSMITLR